MFKYISEILSQFTKTQKIIALILILFSIVIISVGPSFISTITLDKNELNDKIIQQKSLINKQSKIIDSLYLKEMDNIKECTNDKIKREKEFISLLDDLKNDMVKRNNHKINDTTQELESFNNDLNPFIIKIDYMKNIIKK